MSPLNTISSGSTQGAEGRGRAPRLGALYTGLRGARRRGASIGEARRQGGQMSTKNFIAEIDRSRREDSDGADLFDFFARF
jgi:hypothetical protein